MTNRGLENLSYEDLSREIGRQRIQALNKQVDFWGRMLKMSVLFLVLSSCVSFYLVVR